MKKSVNFIKIQSDNQKTLTGFTILGAIVSIFIISVGLSAIMSLVSQITVSATASASHLVAVNLAQEGIEIVRSIREFNYDYSGWGNWHAGVASGNYLAQYNDSVLRPYADMFLNYNAASGLYGYDVGGTASIFKRKIVLTKLSDAEADVVAEVSWSENGRAYKITAEDQLWNWR